MGGRTSRLFGRLAAAGVGGVLGRSVLSKARAAASSSLDRTNHRGRTVSLAAGPAVAVAASLTAGVTAVTNRSPRLAGAFLIAGLGSGAVGLYDDVVGARPEHKTAKGFHGHLGALREGRVTSGLVKIVGVGAAGLAASALLPAAEYRRLPRLRRTVDLALGAGVIAGSANLLNLFDLRPGRAIKAALVLGAPLALSSGPETSSPTGSDLLKARVAAAGAAAGVLGAAAAVLPADLDEEVMIGDCGANSVGALLGLTLAARRGPLGRAILLAGLIGLTAASEKVSFTRVIESTPGLRELDRLGRKP